MKLVVEHPLDPFFRYVQIGFSLYLFVLGIILREQVFVWPAVVLELAHTAKVRRDFERGRYQTLPIAANIASVFLGGFLAAYGITNYSSSVAVAPIIVAGAAMAAAHTRQLAFHDNKYYYLQL